MGIGVAGTILVDIINMIEKYPQKNMLVHVNEISKAVGGCVPNTIINIAKIDNCIPLAAYGKIADDDNGRYVLSVFDENGINTDGIKLDGCNTGFCNAMTETQTGERTFFCANAANNEFDIDDINISSLNCRIFHVGYILLLDELDKSDSEYGTRMARLLHSVQKQGIKTSIDVISEESERFGEKIIPALKYCDYVIMNEIECCRVCGLEPRNYDGTININNIKKAMDSFIEYGVKENVIIHCVEAGFLLNSEKKFTVVPSLELPKDFIKGSVGAGDAYAAACLYGLYNGYSDKELLEFASCAAACNLTAPDSISGMKNKEEIIKIGRVYNRQKIKI